MKKPVIDPHTQHDPLLHDQRRARRPTGAASLARSPDGRIGGVAAGIADFVGADPRRVRWLAALSILLSFGITAVVYLLLWALLPSEKSGADSVRAAAT